MIEPKRYTPSEYKKMKEPKAQTKVVKEKTNATKKKGTDDGK
jgi:hypothetical protein